MAGNGVSSALVKALAAELRTRMPELTAVYDDFPSPNQKPRLPCATIVTGAPDFMPLAPYVVRKEASGETPAPGENARKTIIRTIGKYTFNLQVDLWCATKFDRHKLYETFFAAFHQDPVAPGVRLELEDYYDEWASYTVTGFEMSDSEEGSQRSEWRVIVSITADVRAITESLEHVIETIQNNLETPETIPEDDEESSPSEII